MLPLESYKNHLPNLIDCPRVRIRALQESAVPSEHLLKLVFRQLYRAHQEKRTDNRTKLTTSVKFSQEVTTGVTSNQVRVADVLTFSTRSKKAKQNGVR